MSNAPEKSSEIRTESDQWIWKLRGYRQPSKGINSRYLSEWMGSRMNEHEKVKENDKKNDN